MTPPAVRRSVGTPWLNWPNRLTIGRIVLVAPLVICLLNLNETWPGWRYLAIGLFAVMALSDGLDGFLARRFQSETPLGRFLDPLADKLLITSSVVLLAIETTALPGFKLPSWVPVITIGKDLLTVIGFLLVYATTGQFFIQPRIWGKVCTLLQLVLVAYVLVGPSLPPTWPRLVIPLSALVAGVAVTTLADYVRVGNRFAADHHTRMQRQVNHE